MCRPAPMRIPRLKSLLFVMFALVLMDAPAIAKQDLPAVDADGLHLLEGTKVRIAYAKPGVTLEKYSKVRLLDCYVQFREGWAKEYNMDQLGLNGRVSDKDVEAMKSRLSEEFRAVFTKELNDAGHPVVDETGPDVLLLRPAIVDLQVAAPDLMRAGRTTTWISSAGAMTLYMEMYDSATSELIARVIDPRADPDTTSEQASRVTNKAAADRMLRRWAKLLASHLGDVKQASP